MDRSAVTVPASGRPSSVRDGGLELVTELLRENNALLRESIAVDRELLAELRAMHQDAQRGRRRPSRAALLPELARLTKATGHFNTAQVLFAADTGNHELATALDAAGITSARSLGQFLRSVAGRIIGNLRVECLAQDEDGLIWSVTELEA